MSFSTGQVCAIRNTIPSAHLTQIGGRKVHQNRDRQPPFLRIVSTAGKVRPGPGFVWIAGYWYPVEGHYLWRDGRWARPPHSGDAWVPPHHDGHRYFPGYWEAKSTRDERDRREGGVGDSVPRIKPVSDTR
jgi:hypothetical protein